MSETNVGASVPQQRSTERRSEPGQPMAGPSSDLPEPTGWVGWIIFAGTMMLMLGMFHIFEGFIALFQKSYFLVGNTGLTIHVDYTAWGWTHIILGAIVMATGAGLLAGQTWARVVGVGLALVSSLVNIGFLAAYPVWSAIMVTIDILVIWALTVHGREMKSMHSSV